MRWATSSSSFTDWTPHENKLFENALAEFDSDTPDRWEKIAYRLPGKTPFQIKKHYESLVEDVNFIDMGLVPIPSYAHHGLCDDFLVEVSEFQVVPGGGRGGRGGDPERKKGVPWTEDEHRLFLMGLEKYGKGDWRSISRNFVVTRTPTQVASHAQKFFIRLNSGSKDRRRPSIHDITSANASDTASAPQDPSLSSSVNSNQVVGPQSQTPTPQSTSEPFDYYYGGLGAHQGGSFGFYQQ
ncbi:hypothetical protein AMTRI_Chr09g13860 [Amborella trichopoda]